MEKEILYRMVEIDGIRTKDRKLGEELCELRFALQDITTPVKEILLEMAQVKFIIKQLESFTGYCHAYHLDDMLKKYSLEGEYSRISSINYECIADIMVQEYKKNCRRLKIEL